VKQKKYLYFKYAKNQSMESANYNNEFYFISGGGEMGAKIREKDWGKTSLGEPLSWPSSLKTAVSIMLENPFGMYIAWGAEYIQLYNDGYRPILGVTKHPDALGISARVTFSEILHIIESMFQGVMEGKAVGFPDFILPLNRNGFVEECFFDFSYSPIRMENGQVGGILVTVIETTDRKRGEEALKKSEEKFRTLADNIPNLAWMANEEGWIYWYNEKWYVYTGTTPEEMKGWGWQSVHDPKELPRVMESWQRSINTGKEFEMTFPLKGKDGKFRQFLTRVLPVKDPDGKITHWFGSNTDVTEHIKAEEAAKESELRFRTMAEEAEILIATSDTTGNAIYFNNSWTKLTGRSMDQLVNFGWIDLIHQDDKQKFLNVYMAAFAKQESWTGEFRVLNHEGKYRWLLAKGAVRKIETFAGYISSCVDITERKYAENAVAEKERNLRNTILQAPVAMCILREPNFIVELANDKMFELWGKKSWEMLKKPIFEGLPEVRNQGFEALLENVYKTGETFTAQGVPSQLPRNGVLEDVYLNFVYQAYKESDGSISGIIAVAIDVTAQIVAHQKIEEVVNARTKELKNVNLDLQKSNAELAQFAYIASHDLQEPLRKIKIFSHMLEESFEGGIQEKSKVYLEKINGAASRMNTLIRDVLTYSELVKHKETFEEVNLNTVMESVRADYDLLIEEKGAEVISDDLPIVEAIPLQMAQLFYNLIGNSLKFSKKELRPIISIRVMKFKTDTTANDPLVGNKEYYKIEFRDNGIGFKKEYSDQIFNIFQRLHGKNEYAGTGIGLAMCKKIVVNHHGDLNAEGSSEEGAVFNVILPAFQA
jgi:PAS domain S-box-containing protein